MKPHRNSRRGSQTQFGGWSNFTGTIATLTQAEDMNIQVISASDSTTTGAKIVLILKS